MQKEWVSGAMHRVYSRKDLHTKQQRRGGGANLLPYLLSGLPRFLRLLLVRIIMIDLLGVWCGVHRCDYRGYGLFLLFFVSSFRSYYPPPTHCLSLSDVCISPRTATSLQPVDNQTATLSFPLQQQII